MFSRNRIATSSRDIEHLRCSLCGKNQQDVAKLIAGPRVFICDECIQICNGILAEDQRSELEKTAGGTVETPQPPPVSREDVLAQDLTVPCSLCGIGVPLQEALAIRERGVLCRGCSGEIEAALAENREPRS